MERHQTRSARRQNWGITSHLIRLREKDELEPEVLEKVTKALDIPIEAITELNEGTSINIFPARGKITQAEMFKIKHSIPSIK